MKHKSKKIVTFILSVFLITGLVFNRSTSVQAAIPIPWVGIAWRVASYLNSSFYDVPGTSTSGDYWYQISTGSLSFNDSSENVGASVYRDVKVNKKNLEFDMYAQTNLLNWLSKISIILTDNYGNDLVNKSVDHNQHVYYTTSSSNNFGTWRVRYVQNSKQRWNCWLIFSDYDAAPSSYSTYSVNALSLDSKAPSNYEKLSFVKNSDKTYIIPNLNHKDKKIKLYGKSLSMAELSSQFYDDKNKCYVNSLKNFSVGDKIIFEDTIKDITYDNSTNATYFTFAGLDNEEITWAFANNLTSKYKIGDKLKLKLNVVSEYQDGNQVFENLDYIVNSLNANRNGDFVDINNYQ